MLHALRYRGLMPDGVIGRVRARVSRAISPPQPQAPAKSVHLDMEADFAEFYARASDFTMTSVERMYALYQACRHISDAKIAGEVVECGVWRGGSSMLAAMTLDARSDHRELWLYDTFEGMPPPTDHDQKWDGTTAAAALDASPRMPDADNDWAYAPLETVRAAMVSTGYPSDRVHYKVGRVEQTIPRSVPDRIALLRLDTDWYESTRHELTHLYPRLVAGGILIIDDYGWWQGARKAVDEYFATVSNRPLLSRIDFTGRIAVKPG